MSEIRFHGGTPAIECLRISKDGIWANPDIPVDDIAKQVLEALGVYIKNMIEAERNACLQQIEIIVEAEREACAKVCDDMDESNLQLRYEYRRGALDCADAIRARGSKT